MSIQDTRPRPTGRGERTEIAGHERVRLEISAEHLCHLLASRQLCAADFRCLDGESRSCVRALCQKNCSRYLAGWQLESSGRPRRPLAPARPEANWRAAS
ncbi:MAG TPA: hypothetical protein ENK51_07325 [Gammaproteobacteria bacterium]|nr:hypothetical protein [Gammaproteobacteria bacterium]